MSLELEDYFLVPTLQHSIFNVECDEPSQCVYKKCKFGCGSKAIHRARYAMFSMKSKKKETAKKSSRINYENLRNLLLSDNEED